MVQCNDQEMKGKEKMLLNANKSFPNTLSSSSLTIIIDHQNYQLLIIIYIIINQIFNCTSNGGMKHGNEGKKKFKSNR